MDYWARINKLIQDWHNLYSRLQALQSQIDKLQREQAKIWGS